MKLLKKISIFTLATTLGLITFSCLNDDNNSTNKSYGYLTTSNVSVHPDSIQPINKTTNIKVTYNKTNTCQKFEEFQLINESKDKQYIAVFVSQTNEQNCVSTTSTETKILKFTPRVAKKYTLKFWTGKDVNNKDLYNDSIVLDIKEK